MAGIYRPLMLELPGMHLFAVRLDGKMVSYLTSATEGEVVWLFDVGTVPEHRRKGAARALIPGVIDFYEQRG